MASFPDLRPNDRSADAESVAVLPLRKIAFILAAFAALLSAAFFAVPELATLRGAKAHDASAFLTRELGPPQSQASLVRTPAQTRPALGGKLEIAQGGLRATSGRSAVSLRFGTYDGPKWRVYERGVGRRTSFGSETIAFGTDQIEESLVVERRQGERVWRWQLGTTRLEPSLRVDGSVHFANAGSDSGLSILPVAILDANGKDVTPAGAQWSLARAHGKQWLELRLNDAKLPTPYVIDPILIVGTCGPGAGDFNGCSVHVVSNRSSFSTSPLVRPASVTTGNLMIAQITLRNLDAITAPAGWTQIGNLRTQGTSLEQALYYKVATAGDTAGTTYSWSWTNNADAAGAIFAYSGVDTGSPFDVTPSDNSNGTGTASATGLTTTQNGDMIVAFYGVQGNVTATQDTGLGLTQEYTALSASSPASKVRITGADGTQATAGASGNKTATLGATANWVAHLAALTPTLAADGSGTLTTPTTNVSASQTGRTITFTYTAAAAGMQNGAVTIAVPGGASPWSAPSTTATAPGYTTASTGTVSVASQTITVSGVTLAGGATMTITYGSTAGGGPGATATATTGAQTWQAQQKSRSTGTLTNLGSSPSITVNAADGTGTLTTGTTNVAAGQTGRTITFTYTAAASGGMSNGSVTVDVPSGWSAPSTTGSNAGYTTSSAGTVSVAGQTITVSSVTLAGGGSFTITYGPTAGGGPGATATSTSGAQTWQAQEKSTSTGTLTNLASSPSITVLAADGSGTLTTGTSDVSAGQTGRTITFTYTAGTGGTSSGSVTLAVPAGWSAPSTTGSNAGYTTASSGTVSVAGQTITVSSLTLAAGNTFTITYGSTAGGGPGATATSSTGAQTWQAQEKSTAGGTLTNLASSPSITVYAADGSGTLTTGTTNVSASQTGNTITFTYTAPAGGISSGSITLAVPAGLSAPSTTGSNAGYTTASSGTVSVSGQTITVSSLTLAAGNTFTITYGSTAGGGPGATVTSSTGAQTWQAQEKSTSAGSLANLGSSPSITVNAADGSGTLTTGTTNVSASQTGRTITFTYTAPTGGISGGSVTLAVPAGWSAPSTTGGNAGYTTSSSGTVSVSGQTITVSSLTLAAGNTFTVTYGSTAGGGPGATATSSTGAQTWQAQEKSTSGGSLANLGSSPSITVNAADGAGTLTTGTTNVSASQTGRTITFTYTAPTGGISSGSVTVAAPAGWSAPSTTGSNAGYTTASSGTVSVSGQTITVSSLTLAAGNTFTITYGSTAGGGPGATASSSTGAQTWQAQEKSTSGGSLANLGSSPSITVSAADGSGTLTSSTSAVPRSSTGNTITFTYTAATGGLSNGAVTVDVPAGWNAPSTIGSNAGYTTATAGTVGVAGQTITVSNVTLAGGSSLTITYGSTAGGGPGATAPASTGAQTWQAQEKSTSAGTLANLASSPSITILAADGSGTLTTPTGSVSSASTANTITFTYTAATGGLASGSVTLAVPAGWSAPSTTGTAADYTTASSGTVSVSGQTITVSSLTLAGGATVTVTYGSTAGGGPGATAPVPAGAQTWQAQDKSSAGGTLTNLAASPSITVNDVTAPSAPGLTFGSFTNASVTGTTVYIRQGAAGGFTVTGTSNDAESGIDHLTFPGGFGTGWTGGGADSSSPYQGIYTFTAASTAPAGNQNVTATNGWALTSAATVFTVVADTIAPSVTSPSVAAGYYTSLSVPVSKNGGTDGGSGVDATTSVLQRDDATLTNGSCGSFSGSWTNVTLSGGNDSTVVTGKCYVYRELLSDNVGNQGASAASNIAKIDTSAPSTPTLSFSNLSANAYWDGSSTLYFRPSAAGTFTVTAAATDGQSGIASYTFGTLNSNGGANWGGSQTGDHFDYTFDGTTSAPGTARTVSATNGATTSSGNATYTIAADTTAPAVTAPGVTAGYYTSLSVQVTKNGGSDGGSGVNATTSVLERDDAALSNGTCGSFSGSWTTVTLSGGNDTGVSNGRCYEYRELLSDRVGNQGTSAASNIAKVDSQGPANSLSLSSVSPAGSAYKSGTTVFYRGSATGGGSFKLTNAVSDSEAGPASSATAALGGTTSGWSHTASTVSTPAGGPYDSNSFSWNQGTTSSPTEVVTGADAAGNTTAAASLAFTDDSTAPTGGALTVNGVAGSSGGSQSYDGDGSFPIDVRTDYAESASGSASGLASSTLVRTSASFTSADTCSAFGSPSTISGNPSQSGLATGCYRYTLTGTDNVGNTVSVSTTVKVDTSAPTAPSLAFASLGGGAYYPGSGTRVYFKPDAATGTFDLTGSSTDNDSGVASYTFPTGAAIGTNWSRSGSGATRTYSYTATATTNGAQDVTATNDTGLTSGTSTFDVTADSTAPAGGALTVNGIAASAGGTSSYDSDGSFPIDARTDYAESQTATASGLASSTVVRTSASYTSPNVCGSFGSPTTISGNPNQSGLATGCYLYTLTGTDNVGNAVSVSTTVKVDNSAPMQPTLAFSSVTGGAYYPGAGSRVFFKPNATGGGSFDLTAGSTDNDTDVASYQFPSGATVGTNWSFSGSGATRTYSYTPTATTNGSQSVTATNNAGGISTGASFDVTADSTAPAGGALSVNGVAASGGGSQSYDADGSFAIDARTDYSETASTTESGLASSTLTRENAALSSDSCGSFGSSTTLVGAPAQSGLATGCYRYTLTGTDRVGNAVSISTIVKVDTSAPSAPSLTLSNTIGGAYYSGSGSRVFFRPNAAAGSFDLSASATDADTSVASYGFPTAAAIGTNWSVSGSGSARTYSYTASATTNGAQNVNATNASGLTSGNTSFDVTVDSTAPAGGALTVSGTAATGGGSATYDTDGSFAIDSRTDYTEAASATESGLASSTLTRESATLSGDSCGSFGSATTLAGTPGQSGLATGCYRYRLTGTDNVGNAVSVTTIVKVDTSAPSAPSLSLSNVTGGAYYSGAGTTVFFQPTAANGSFDVAASATDGDTGVASYQFPAGAALGTNWSGSGSGASRTYSFTAVATTNGSEDVTATNTAGGVSANGSFTVAADSTASTTSVQCNGAACIAGYYTSAPVSVTLSANDGAGSGIQKIRYTTDGSDPSPVNGSDYAGAINVNTTTTVKFRAYDNLGNEEAVGSQTILLDGTAPTGPALTLTENPANAAQHVSGTTLFYRPGASGTFRVAAATDDPETGVTQVVFPSVSNVTGGSTQTSAPYREDYSWGASTSDSGSHSVVASNGAGASSNAGFTLAPDSTAPTGQAITLTGASAPYFGSASVAFSLGDGTDGTGSGVDASTRTVTRETGNLVGDSCSGFTADAGTFSSPDTAVSSGHCYRYSFSLRDNVGNLSAAVTATAKVDTAPPAVAVTAATEVTGAGSQYYDAGSKTQFFRPGGSGSFTLNATGSDVDTGVTGVAFPDVSATSGWAGSTGGSDATSPYSSPVTYAWSSGAGEPGAVSVVATDKAANTASDTVTLRADGTAPSGQTIALTGAGAPYYTSASVTFITGDGSDNVGGSGLDTSTRTVTRETGDLAGDSCSNFTADGGTFSTPDTAISGGHCYRYSFTIKDNVGNVSAAATATAKVDTTAPATPTLSFGSFTNASATGTTVFFRQGAAGGFTVAAGSSDPETGIATTSFPALGSGWTNTGGAYSFSAAASAPSGNQNVTSRNGAGVDSVSTPFTVVADTATPISTIKCNGVGCSAGWYTSSPVSVTMTATDGFGSGVDRIRYTTDGSDPTQLNGSDYSGAIAVGSTMTIKYRAYDNVGNAEAVASQTVQIDTTPPAAPALTLNEASPFEFVSGTTLFYNPSGSNSAAFTVSATSSDGESAIQKASFPSLTGMVGGGDDTSSPYQAGYGWDNTATTSPGSNDVTAYNNANLTSQSSFTVTKDVAAPTGQTITLAGANAPYYKTASVSFSLGDGSDGTGAGLDLSSRTVTRETANLAGNSCASFSADAGSFSSPDTAVSGGHCYRYTFTIKDNVGNVSSAITATAKVDTAAPAVSVTAPTETAGGGNQYYDAGTKTQFFRSTGSGSFDLNATASDGDTAVTGVGFPDLSGVSGWSGSGGTDTASPYGSSYSWSAGAAEPGAENVSAADKATNSASDTITIADDTTAPSGQAIALTGANPPYFTSASVSFSLTNGSDSGSGLDLASRTVTRETGDLAGNVCSNFAADAGSFSSPDTAVSGGHCYRYTFTIKDNVGNDSAAVAATAKVDTTAPATPSLSFGSFTNASTTGTSVFFRQGQTGGFTVTAPSSDPETGVASTSFPALGSGWSNGGGAYSFNASATAPSGSQSVTARNAAGVDSAAATFTVSADTAAPTTSAQCNGSACSSGWYSTSPVSVALSANDGSGSGVDRIRYTTDGSDPSPVNGSDYSGAINIASTATVKFRAYDLVGNEEAVGSQLVRIDTTAPSAPALTLNESSPFEFVSGTTLFYNPSGSNSGSFTVDAITSDAGSGIQKVSFPALTGMGGGGDDTNSPYQGSYSWNNTATTSPGANDVTAHNNAALTAQTPFTVTKDVTAPSGGSVDYPNGFQTSTSVTITTADGNDGTGAGLDATTGVLERQTAALSNRACGSFGSWSTVTSPDTVASGTCAAYRYRISDRIGNEAVYPSAKVVKVDSSAPAAPSLTLSESSPLEFVSGTTLYYNPSGSNSASFSVGATAADAQSGIAQIDFPTVFGGDSSSQGSGPFSNGYSWTGGASASGAETVTATNGSGLQSTADFTVTPDTSAPNGGTFDYPDGYSTTGSVTITTPSATDGGAGLDASSAVLERRTATLSGGSCGSYGGWATVTSPDTVANGLCAVYRFRVSDNVGNEAIYTSAHVVKVDSAGPTVSLTDPGTPVAGTIAVSATASDTLSNVQQVVFERAPAGGSTWTQIGAPDTTFPYSVNWNTTLVADSLYDLRAIATDNAGNTTTSSVVANRRVDNTAPDTTIDASPANPSSNATPSFSFSSSESGSTFECSVEGGSWSSCSSPHTLAALAEGSHTFDVRAIDTVGNTDATPASYAWTVDLTPPTATWNSPASGANVSAAVTLDASSEPGATVAYSYSAAGGNTWTSTSSSWNTVPLSDGAYDLRAIATDTAGNPSAPAILTNIGVDNHAPTVSIMAPTSYLNAADPNPFTITASTTDSDLASVKFYECSDASTACSTGTWNLIGTDPTAPYSTSWNAPVADGRRAIRALATDNAANTGTDVQTITIDRTAPSNVTVSYPGGYASGSVTITTGNGPDPDVDATTAILDRQTATLTNDTCGSFGAFSSVTSPDAVPSGQCAKYRYRVSDQAGNVSTATSAAVVKRDTAAPTSLQDDPGAYLRQSVSLSASASDTGGSGITSVSFERRSAGGGAWTAIGSDATSPYSVSFDTTLVADGLYDFRTVATDAAGNAEASPTVVASRRIDNTPPSGSMLAPADASRVKGSVALTASTVDSGSGVAGFSFELAPVPGAFASVATPWDTTGVIDGDYRLRVVVTDNAGNTTNSSVVTTTVDNTPPSVIFSSPAGGSVVSGTVALDATASDSFPANPAVGFAYKLHSDPPSAYTSTPASWNTAAIDDGLYDLRATASDAAGNATQVENTSILADNFPPTISITAPATSINASVPSPTAFDATAGDPGSGVQKVDLYECSNNSTDCATGTWNLLLGDGTPPYGASWTIPADGNHALRAVAIDNANHTSAAIRNVNVDRTAPNTTITGKPANPSNAPATFTFTSTESGSTFECALDGGAWAPCTSPEIYAGLADGTHTVDVRATDAAGNVDPTPDSWTWLRDTTAPTATIGDPGANVRLTVNLTSTESDPGGANASGIATTQFEYSGNGGSSWAPTAAAWNTTTVTDGLYKVHVVVTDNAGNQTTVAVGHDVRVDNTAPTTSQDDPGPFLRATKTLTGSAADSGSGIDHVDFQRSPAGAGTWTTIASDSSSPYSAPFDTTTVADAHYDFRTVANDVAGNQTSAGPVANRLVDNTVPNATMSDPGPYLRSTVNLTSTTSDPNGTDGSGVASVAYEYSSNGGATWTPTTAAFNSSAIADGNVQLHVIATDNAGNVATSAAVTDLVDNTKPVTSDNAPSGYQSSPVTVMLSPADAGSGVNVTQYAVDGGSFQVGTSVNIPAPADGSNDGAHTIAYFSADNAGNIEQVKSTTVLIDATPPTCPSCAAADYLRGTVTLSASPSSGASGIQSVTFQYSPAGMDTWTTIGAPDTTGPAPYTANWNTTTLPDGHYDLRIAVVSGAGTSSTTDLPDKVVDNTPPNVATVGAPTEGAIVSGSVAITASAADVTSPIASVEFFVRGVSIATDSTAPYSLNWNSASGPDGTATIYVVVTDMAGNSKTSALRTITVDNGAPTPTLADPGANLSGTVDLTATSDADTAQVDFQRATAGSGTWTTIATDNTAPFSASLNTTLLPDGLYDFRVVAVDVHGNSGTSAVRTNVRIDNTAPTGSLTSPAGGAMVGGSSVSLAASTSDTGSGVASVRYEYRPTGGSSFTPIVTSTTSPFAAAWDTSGLASGSYDLRPVITDRAGNVFTGAVVTVSVDATAPTVTLADPGGTLAGTVQLNATVTGSGATKVTFGFSAAGANSWSAIATDTTSPYSASFDTSKLDDGLYDLRAVVYDALSNSSHSVRSNIRIDNNAPRLVSSTPSDGARVDDAGSIELVLSELGTATGVTLDGVATVAPVVNGMHITYGMGTLAVGAHTLAGELKDASGHSAPFRIHFTVWKLGSDGVAPMIEKNTSAIAGTTLTSADGFASVTMPAGAWTGQGNDWLVLGIKPLTQPTGLTNGFGPSVGVVDVTAYWALAGGLVREFAQPIHIVLPAQANSVVPATSDGSGWRVLRRVPSAPVLPAAWNDGFYKDAAGFHLLTRHLTEFSLLRDFEAPSPPSTVRVYSAANGLRMTWKPGPDNSGTYDNVSVRADGSLLGAYAAGTTEATVAASASSAFTLRETDLTGNESSEIKLVPVPPIVGLSPEDAAASLEAAGLHAGNTIGGGSGPAGTVTGPAGLLLAEEGATIDLTLAGGSGGPGTKFVFGVVSTPKLKMPRQRTIGARVKLTRAARVTAVLYTGRNLKLYTWRVAMHAGTSIVKLGLPSQMRRPGIFRIRWTATSGLDTLTRAVSLRLLGTRKGLGPVVNLRAPRVEVVLAGRDPKKRTALAFSPKGTKVVSAAGADAAFDLAAANNGNVQVIVVDVDAYGVGFVRDLHTVFPNTKIVALASSSKQLKAAKRAGATVGLRRSTPSPKIAKVIRNLLSRR